MDNQSKERLIVVAGQGKFPIMIAREAKRQGLDILVIALKGYTPDELSQEVSDIHWFELGQISEMLKTVKNSGIKEVALAGRVPHDAILHYKGFDSFSKGLISLLVDKKANSILKMIASVLAKNGLRVVDTSRFLKSYIPGKGLLTSRRAITPEEEKEIKFGLPIVRKIADMDIGLMIVVKNQIVVAIEGMEGTDRAIQRGAELAGEGIVIIKVARSNQDPRWDLPVVGLRTIKLMHEVKASALAISAQKTLFFDIDEAIRLAEESDIGIIAL